MDESQYDNKRQEYKYLIPACAETELKNILALDGWNEQFPKRQVHTIYFDTINNDFLFDSIYGISNRVKYRARWYNTEKFFVIECKTKNAGIGGKAISQKFPFTAEFPSSSELSDALLQSFGQQLPQLSTISYDREYFFHAKSHSRLTIDDNYISFDYHSHVGREIKNSVILEVKAGVSASFVVPFGQFQSRFSKYCFSRVGDDSFY